MKIKIVIALIFCGLIGFQTAFALNEAQTKQARTLINLLDYLGKDYYNAVKNGKVVSESEYSEMQEFSTQMVKMYQQLDTVIHQPAYTALQPQVQALHTAIHQKADFDEVHNKAMAIKAELLKMQLIKVSPAHWPDLEKGKMVYADNCQSCHGADGKGNGPLAEGYNPAPANFHNDTLAGHLSPFQAFNTVRLGIEGTGMKGFDNLSDEQAWDVAFYINSLHYTTDVPQVDRENLTAALKDSINLEALATWTNDDWKNYLNKHNLNVEYGMAVLRSFPKIEHAKANKDLLQHAIDLMHEASTAYKAGNMDVANTLALNAYLKGVEPKEAQIKASDPSLVLQIENEMIAVRSAIKQEATPAVVDAKIANAEVSIQKAQEMLGEQNYSFWFTYLVSASILLREALEAFLIIVLILGVLRSVNAERAIRFIHGGWIVALLAGVMSWFFAENLINMGSTSREIMEGVGSIVAVLMLMYIGFWLHNKTHASQWTKFVKEKIHRLVNQNNLWGLGVLSFIVVFREAFESVIFLSSISIKADQGADTGIALGALSALVLVIGLGMIFMKFSKRLPIKSLFKFSAITMAVLAFVLAGKGMHEFQEAGYIGIQALPFNLNVPLLGMFPTWQTLVSQIVVLTFTILLWQYSNRRALAKG